MLRAGVRRSASRAANTPHIRAHALATPTTPPTRAQGLPRAICPCTQPPTQTPLATPALRVLRPTRVLLLLLAPRHAEDGGTLLDTGDNTLEITGPLLVRNRDVTGEIDMVSADACTPASF